MQRKITNKLSCNIYSQNLSGAKTKVYIINQFLATTLLDILFIQETWFNESVNDSELVASTNFIVLRKDCSVFQNKRTVGGGVAIFIRRTIQYTELDILQSTALEHIIVRIKLGKKFFTFVNIYLPPYRTRLSMVSDLSIIMRNLRKANPSDDIVLVGDFNMSSIQWEFDGENLGFLVGKSRIKHENKFINICAANGLNQINPNANSNRKYLDLIMASTVHDIHVSNNSTDGNLDRATAHHNPINFIITYQDNIRTEDTKSNLNRICLRSTREQLQSINFPPITQEIQSFFWDSDNVLTKKIEETIAIIANVQDINTHSNINVGHLNSSTHPWMRNSRYSRIYKERHKAKANHLRFGTIEKKNTLNALNIQLYKIYNGLKHKYYLRVIDHSKKDPRSFYSLAKTKFKSKSPLPAIMTAV